MSKHFIFILLLFFTLLITSCKKNSVDKNSNYQVELALKKEIIKYENRVTIANVLVKVLANEKEIRHLLKNKANERFNGDFDVLFDDIKDIKIGNKTVIEIILTYTNNKSDFISAINNNPLLTLYVPELPSGWNAKNWNADTEVPDLAVAPNELDLSTKSVLSVKANGTAAYYTYNQIPLTPTIVVKENERLNSELNPSRNLFYKKIQNIDFYFLDEIYMFPQEQPTTINQQRTYKDNALSPDVIAAYNLNLLEWPRDYIYYGINPSNPNGPFSGRNSETIKSIWFTNTNSFYTASDQSGDPVYQGSYWIEGYYELYFTIYLNGRNGVGTSITKFTSIHPTNLWNIQVNYNTGLITSITPIPYNLTIDITPFNIQDYSTSWKYNITEYDPSQTVTNTSQYQSTFATNFELSVPLGETVKVGLKFGVSASIQITQTHTVTTTLTSDNFGDFIVSFSDPLIVAGRPRTLGIGMEYDILDYTTGTMGINIIPTRRY